MAAIIHSNPFGAPRHPPSLRLLPGGQPHRRTPATYRRRRCLALLVATAAAVGLSIGGWMALEAYAPPPPASSAAMAPAASGSPATPVQLTAGPVVVVQPGDSLWSIAQRAHPDRDPRPVVTRLARFHGTGPLQPGERLPVP